VGEIVIEACFACDARLVGHEGKREPRTPEQFQSGGV
jgi:hypothetical protein